LPAVAGIAAVAAFGVVKETVSDRLDVIPFDYRGSLYDIKTRMQHFPRR
jgi:hypothetical protein